MRATTTPATLTLQQVRDLHPKAGSAADFREATQRAEQLQADFLARASDLEAMRNAGLLSMESKDIFKAESDAAELRLAAARIAAILPAIRKDLLKQDGIEQVEALRVSGAAAAEAVNRLIAWRADSYEKIAALIAEAFAIQDAAVSARRDFVADVAAAYERPEVRDIGPLGIEVPEIPSFIPDSSFSHFR